jgi:DNA-binding HxlR family transcriptional regulator
MVARCNCEGEWLMAEGDVGWTDPSCPVARAADLVGDRWSILVMRDAMDGAHSFNEFQRRTGIARNILSDRLRKLVARGLLAQVDAGSGRRTRYELTDVGTDLFPVVVALRQWGERHAFADGEAHSVLVDSGGDPVPLMAPVARTGAVLAVADTHVRRVD